MTVTPMKHLIPPSSTEPEAEAAFPSASACRETESAYDKIRPFLRICRT